MRAQTPSGAGCPRAEAWVWYRAGKRAAARVQNSAEHRPGEPAREQKQIIERRYYDSISREVEKALFLGGVSISARVNAFSPCVGERS